MAGRNEFMYDFWVMYEEDNEADQRIANGILNFLETGRPLRGFVIHRDASLGQTMFHNLEHALRNSRYILALLSNSSVQDGWWEHQTQTSLFQQIESRREALVPIYLPGLDMENIPLFLGTIQGVAYDDDRNSNFWASILRLFN